MGKVLSIMGRPFRDFNLESRAHKLISRDKPIAAPKHKQTDVDQLIKDFPEVYAESLKKHEGLDHHLKNVYVTSRNPQISKQKIDPDRPLPMNRSVVQDYEYGFNEPEEVPVGKTTLRRAMQFITHHQQKPEIYTYKNIAEQETLSEETVRTILKYFKIFEVYVPQQNKTKAKFAGPGIPRTKIIIEKMQLESGLKNKSSLKSRQEKDNVT